MAAWQSVGGDTLPLWVTDVVSTKESFSVSYNSHVEEQNFSFFPTYRPGKEDAVLVLPLLASQQ